MSLKNTLSPRPARKPLYKTSTEHDHPLKPLPLPPERRPTQDEIDFESPAEIPTKAALLPPTLERSAAGILNEASPTSRGPDRFGAHVPKAAQSPHVQTKRFRTAYGLGSSSSAFIDAGDISKYTRELLSLALRPSDTVYYEREDDEQQITILVLRPRGKNPVYPEHYQRQRQIGDGYLVKQRIQVFEDGIVLHLPIQIVACCEEHDHRLPLEPEARPDNLAAETPGSPSKLTAKERIDGVLANILRKARPKALQIQKFVDRIDEGEEEAIKEVEERYDVRVEKLEKRKVWYEYQAYVREHSAGDPRPDLEDLFPTPKTSKQGIIDLNKPLPPLPTDQHSRHDSVLDHAMA
ncbi:hypothetical protein HII31_07601 [Pseudocercospora fuligena]|uniref:Uncharacterized protein n=1 Tax=Pseudocercospora fuligena TaxID=685502 RepID=A0A8H6REJ8_9PEZI|nr:hypothetical protein HII31_07601 [Pseudocercospora fuligena]